MPDTSNITKQKQPNWNELSILENGNFTQPNNAQAKNLEQTPSQEQKLKLENLKRVMNSEKTS